MSNRIDTLVAEINELKQIMKGSSYNVQPHLLAQKQQFLREKHDELKRLFVEEIKKAGQAVNELNRAIENSEWFSEEFHQLSTQLVKSETYLLDLTEKAIKEGLADIQLTNPSQNSN